MIRVEPATPEASPAPPNDAAARFGAAVRKGFAWFRRWDRGLRWLIPPVLLYVAVWSYLTVAKYYALTATVWDLGAGMQDMWTFTQPQSYSPLGYLEAVIGTPVHFFLAPFGYAGNYPAVLVFQTVALAMGAFPVYLIARDLLNFRPAAYSVAIAYLVYFPLAGVNWYDFHFEALFIPLFLFGYLAFLRRWSKTSLTLFIVGGTTTYPYLALVALFAFLTLLEALVYRRYRKWPVDPWVVRFAVTLLIIASLYLAYQYWYWTLSFGNSYLTVGTNTSGGFALSLHTLGLGAIVIVLILAPLLFLTCRSPKWLLMLAPIAFLIFASTYFGYHYPTVFRDQYLAAAIPFVLIGAIYGLRSWGPFQRPEPPTGPSAQPDPPASRWRLSRPPSRWTIVATLLVAGVAFSLVLQPYGPLNGRLASSFDVGTSTDINWSAFRTLTTLASLVPGNDPSVLIQNNMPELLPRPLQFDNTPLTTSILRWQDITPSEVASDQYALRLIEGNLVTTPLSYAVVDSYSPWFTIEAPGSNFSMSSVSNLMYASGLYGIVGESGGLVVLERGYSGSPEYYVPYSATFPANQLYSGLNETRSKTPVITGANLFNQTLWYGPYSEVSPGMYRISVSVESSSTASGNHFKVGVRTTAGAPYFASFNVSGADLAAPNVWQTVSFVMDIATITNALEITGYGAFWQGSLSVEYVSLQELAPPTA